MSRQQYSTRLPEDQANDLEQYCEERNVSKSEALRRSVERLTEQKNTEQDQNGSETELYWRIAMVSGILLLAVTQAGAVSSLMTVLGAGVPLAFLVIWAVTR